MVNAEDVQCLTLTRLSLNTIFMEHDIHLWYWYKALNGKELDYSKYWIWDWMAPSRVDWWDIRFRPRPGVFLDTCSLFEIAKPWWAMSVEQIVSKQSPYQTAVSRFTVYLCDDPRSDLCSGVGNVPMVSIKCDHYLPTSWVSRSLVDWRQRLCIFCYTRAGAS